MFCAGVLKSAKVKTRLVEDYLGFQPPLFTDEMPDLKRGKSLDQNAGFITPRAIVLPLQYSILHISSYIEDA